MQGIKIMAVALKRDDANRGKRHDGHKEVGDRAKHALQVTLSADCLPGPQHQPFPMLGQYYPRHCRPANLYFRRHITVKSNNQLRALAIRETMRLQQDEEK
jgi:hypothetical protein